MLQQDRIGRNFRIGNSNRYINMLTIFYGNDAVSIREAAYKSVAQHEETGASIEVFDVAAYQPGMLTSLAGGTSLFGGQFVYVIDTPSQTTELFEELVSNAQLLAESSHTFVVIEGALAAAPKKQLTKAATEVTEFKKQSTRAFNTFSLADALSKKDKRSLWVGLCDAKRAGCSDEEVIGILWWQLKTLRLAAITSTAADAGMKDFPYNKAKRSLSSFADGELTRLARSLLALYHNARGGGVEMDLALERWVLGL